MRFVLANRLMTLAGGTEWHLVTIGDQLLRLGHEVMIYSPEIGPFADYARERGIEVVDRVRELPEDCDVVLAQDGLVVYDLAERFPQARMVFRVCGDSFDFQSPPQLNGIVDVVVVLSDRYARLAQACAVNAPLLRLRVPVDVDRLAPVGAIRAEPKRAVILGNYPDRKRVIQEAWEPGGIEVSQVGGTQQRYDIAAALEGADIVVAKSRAAVDAMACGRAVFIFDTFGGDGWVTPEVYAAMEADNFAGQATDRVIGRADLERDLADYDPEMGIANRDLAVQHHAARDHVAELVAAVTGRPTQERPIAPFRELSRLTALQWSWERFTHDSQKAHSELYDRFVLSEQERADLHERLAGSERERADLRERLLQAEQATAEASAITEGARAELANRTTELEALRAELDGLHASRAWRLCSRYWRWRDRFLRRTAEE